jgi:hypothetical protein
MVIRLTRAVRARLGDETGMALVMAIGVSATIAIMGGSLVLYSTSNEKTANRSKVDLRAYQLAQAGLDAAASVIAAQPLTNGRQTSTLFSSQTVAQKTLTFGTGESVVYDGTLYDDTPVAVVSPLVRAWRWVVTATASVPSPNAGSANRSRTLSATMLLSPRAAAPSIQSQAWKYIYSTIPDDGTITCEITLDNNSDFDTSFYTNGTLCLQNQGDINANPTGPAVDVIAKGGIWINQNNAWIGKSAAAADRINRVETPVNGCKFQAAPAGLCNNANHVNATTVVVVPPGPATTVSAPTTSFTDTALLASPGPQHPCQTRSGSYPDFASMTISSTFNLTGGTYVCRNAAGELSYDASTRLLTVRGLVYFPGSVTADGNVAVQYQGIGALYIAGTYHQQQTALCAAVSGSTCNWTDYNVTTNPTGWIPANSVLLIAAAGGGTSLSCGAGPPAAITLEQQTQFQGALYANGTSNICYQNQSTFQGPSVAYAQYFDNQVNYMPMPAGGIVRVPFGAPGQTNPVTDYDVTPLTNYTG